MVKCLDCGFLYPTWEKEESEYPQTERKKLRTMPREAQGPCGLGCFRSTIEFPGNPHSRFSIGFGPRTAEDIRREQQREQQNREEDATLIAALEKEWNCELFTPHIPGLKPSEHLALQQSRDWEAQQEQARRAWEKAQEDERQRFQERLTERQESFETEQRRRDRRIAACVALIVPIISFVISVLTRDIQFGPQPQFSTTAPASPAITATTVLTPTHTITPAFTLTPTYTPTASQP